MGTIEGFFSIKVLRCMAFEHKKGQPGALAPAYTGSMEGSDHFDENLHPHLILG
jgi:hypothetical protein